jgi:hypothetical protein
VFVNKIKYSLDELKEFINTVEIGIATINVTKKELRYQKLIFLKNIVYYDLNK